MSRGRAVAALLTSAALAAGAAAGAATALAAHPKKGAHFSGSFSFTGINGFKAPVAFTVSKNGKTITGFRYSTLGCFGGGGFQPGVDYYTKPFAFVNVGTIKVSASGRFSAKGVPFKYTASGFTTITTSTVSGSFTSAKSASGTVTFVETLQTGAHCNSLVLSFKAKA